MALFTYEERNMKKIVSSILMAGLLSIPLISFAQNPVDHIANQFTVKNISKTPVTAFGKQIPPNGQMSVYTYTHWFGSNGGTWGDEMDVYDQHGNKICGFKLNYKVTFLGGGSGSFPNIDKIAYQTTKPGNCSPVLPTYNSPLASSQLISTIVVH